MVAHQNRQDPQDKQFGAAASADQDFVDELDDEGVSPDDLPGGPSAKPRAGNKAEPDPSDAES